MNIAIDTNVLPDNSADNGYFLRQIWKKIIKNYPEHQFIIIASQSAYRNFLLGNNVTVVKVRLPKRYQLLWKLWKGIRLPSILKKYKADVFISGNGSFLVKSKTPLCIVAGDLNFLHALSSIKNPGLFFFKKNTSRNLIRADGIIIFSEFAKKHIIAKYGINHEKITIVPPVCIEKYLTPVENKKEEVKRKYTEGKNFFLYAGIIRPQKNLINLLKAFSVFKKRQKSDWKIILAGNSGKRNKNFAKKFSAYKYRDDVVMMVCSDEEIVELTGAAYAFVYPTLWEISGMAVLGPMNSHIPVITSVNSPMQEIAGDAALYVDPADHIDIADKMMLIYKNESLRNNLIDKGKIVALQYNLEKTADLLWQCLLKACANSGKTNI